MGIVAEVGAAVLGSLCSDGEFGDKLPGSQRCPYCGAWLCAKHYSEHINQGRHHWSYSPTPCADSGAISDESERVPTP